MLALAATPLLASAAVGTAQVLSRRVRVGQELELAGRRGKVTEVGLFDLHLRDAAGHEVRVPHLFALTAPLKVVAGGPRLSVELQASAASRPAATVAALTSAASRLGASVLVELRDIDASAARFSVSLVPASTELTESVLRIALVEALAEAGIALGGGRAS
jgi:small-conductance mechanosensitive channel